MNAEQALQLLAEAAMKGLPENSLHRKFYQQAVEVLATAVQRLKAHSEEAPEAQAAQEDKS